MRLISGKATQAQRVAKQLALVIDLKVHPRGLDLGDVYALLRVADHRSGAIAHDQAAIERHTRIVAARLDLRGCPLQDGNRIGDADIIVINRKAQPMSKMRFVD